MKNIAKEIDGKFTPSLFGMLKVYEKLRKSESMIDFPLFSEIANWTSYSVAGCVTDGNY